MKMIKNIPELALVVNRQLKLVNVNDIINSCFFFVSLIKHVRWLFFKLIVRYQLKVISNIAYV